MEAATRVIVTQGLSAPTATIAQEAGVSNGSLFTYFETKANLFNQLYLDLKTGMAAAALEGFPAGDDQCARNSTARRAKSAPSRKCVRLNARNEQKNAGSR